MAPTNKTNNKKKGKAPKTKSTASQGDEQPDLQELNKRLDSYSQNKRKRQDSQTEDSCSQTEDDLVLSQSSEEQLPSSTLRELKTAIKDLKQQKEEHSQQIRQLKAKYETKPNMNYQWKKEAI